jgi:hypothetical protein
MPVGKRREPRSVINRRAWINVGDGLPLRNCTLIDISEGGARLSLDDVNELPDKFSLWLSRHGNPSYVCRIAWSGQNTIGVEFELAAGSRTR